MILNDATLAAANPATAELGAFVHVDDVSDAIVRAVSSTAHGHHRVTLCGPGAFDTSAARELLNWRSKRGWPVTE